MEKVTIRRNVRIIFSLLALFFSLSFVHAQVSVTGGTSATYGTLKAAFDAINAGTHSGNIVVTITANTTETATATLNSGTSGSASYTSVVVKPSGFRSVTGSLSGVPLIKLNGAQNVRIDGLHNGTDSLKISNTSTGGAGTCTIQFIADANTDTVQNCTLLGSPGFSTTGIVHFSTATSTGNTDILVTRNNIGPASNSVANYQAVYSSGTFNKPNINNTISYNNIFDFSNMGVSLTSGGGTGNGWNISNNSFFRSANYTYTTSYPNSAININSSSSNSCVINGNYIGGKSINGGTTSTPWNNGTGGFVGINIVAVGTTTASTLLSNRIQNFTSASTITTPTFSGIQLQAGKINVGDGTDGNKNVIGNAASNLGISIGSTFANNVYLLYCNASSSATIEINNNEIANVSYTGTSNVNDVLYGIYYSSTCKPVIKNCKIHDMTTSCAYTSNNNPIMTGIYTNASAAVSPVIQGNEIYNLSATSTAVIEPLYAISLTGTSVTPASGDVSANYIHNLGGTNNTASTAVTIGINVAGGSCNYYNNMIQLGVDASGATITKGIPLIGINYPGGTTRANHFFFNTVFVGGLNTTSSANTFCFYRAAAPLNTPSDSLRNNIFYNARTNSTGSAKNYAIADNGVTTRMICDYNDLYGGTNLASTVAGSGTATTFANWKSTTGFDTNSQNGDPNFVSTISAPPNFHLTSGTVCDATGTAVTTISIPNDFYGTVRATATPVDIGAVVFKIEQNPGSFDAAPGGSTQIDLTATANGDGDNIVVVQNLTGSFTAPTNGVAPPAAGNSFAGGTVVYVGSAAGLTNDVGLSPTTTYYYKAFSYDGNNVYSSGLTDNATTLAAPSISYNSSLSNEFTTYGVASSYTTFTAEGDNLIEDILVSPPTGFEVSLSPGSGYGPTVSLPLTGNSVATTTVYVRLASTTPVGLYSGNIALTSTGELQNVDMPFSTVSEAELFVYADNQDKCTGDVFTFDGTEFTTSGLLNGDDVTSVTLTSTGSGSGAAPDVYPIVASSAVGSGLSNYSITYVDGEMTVADCKTSQVTAINAELKGSFIAVYPNPANDKLWLSFSCEGAQDVSLQLRTITGQLVDSKDYTALANGDHLYSFNVQSLPAGIYIVTLVNDKQSASKRINIMH